MVEKRKGKRRGAGGGQVCISSDYISILMVQIIMAIM